MTRRQAQALKIVRLAIDAARKTGLTDDQISEAINLPFYFRRVTVGTKSKKGDNRENVQWRGAHVGDKWDVFSWDSRVGNRAKQHNGCVKTKMCAERLVVSLSREHPDRTYQIEQCKHSDQAQAKAARA
jgi:hypothetical protein